MLHRDSEEVEQSDDRTSLETLSSPNTYCKPHMGIA